MIRIEAPWSVLLLELTALLALICLLQGLRAWRRRRRERAAVHQLVAAVKEEKDARRQQIRTLLASRYAYQGEALEERTAAIGRAEWRFYQTLINIYLRRDAAAVATLHRALAEVIEPYHQLPVLTAAPAAAPLPEPPREQPAPAPRPAPAAMQAFDGVEALDGFAEMQHLREENERLGEELQITMSTISRMLSEYSSIVGRDGAEAGGEDFMDMFNEESAG